MPDTQLILSLHLISSLMMAGVIWMVQIVHYPSFRYIDPKRYNEFQLFHMNRISWVVIPLMGVELLTALLLLEGIQGKWVWINALMVILLWVYTFLVSARIHQKLVNEYDEDLVERLIWTNWPRTLIWAAHALLATALL